MRRVLTGNLETLLMHYMNMQIEQYAKIPIAYFYQQKQQLGEGEFEVGRNYGNDGNMESSLTVVTIKCNTQYQNCITVHAYVVHVQQIQDYRMTEHTYVHLV